MTTEIKRQRVEEDTTCPHVGAEVFYCLTITGYRYLCYDCHFSGRCHMLDDKSRLAVLLVTDCLASYAYRSHTVNLNTASIPKNSIITPVEIGESAKNYHVYMRLIERTFFGPLRGRSLVWIPLILEMTIHGGHMAFLHSTFRISPCKDCNMFYSRISRVEHACDAKERTLAVFLYILSGQSNDYNLGPNLLWGIPSVLPPAFIDLMIKDESYHNLKKYKSDQLDQFLAAPSAHRKLLLLLCARKHCPASPFFADNFPLDMLKLVVRWADLAFFDEDIGLFDFARAW